MDALINFCHHVSSLDINAKKALHNANFESKFFKKGEPILRENSYCNHLYFITKGLTKFCFSSEEKEFIMRFFPENILFTNLDNYTSGRKSKYKFIAIEDTSLIQISITEFELLCKQHHSIETFYRKFMTMANKNMMERISEMLEEEAKNRYENFTKKFPFLMQRVSLGDLSNYLGITQVSLSRIRAK
ncbi:Crp/Fnr family transcriptional regulator [Tenacibaculum xiamenense]|uniref:Crp/Fnr family transcriptional regulator n=1 Tax=Tenacibaculum xiamenense TaxID=1261553 RepID=UPI003892FE52